MANDYLTTTAAAEFCGVTRFTIRNWVTSFGLKAYKTAGGHRRILKRDFMVFMKENKIAEIKKNNPCRLISPCWEFQFKDTGEHDCVNCLVFKEGADKCFLLSKSFGQERIQCRHECLDCAYIKKYYPAKRAVMEKMKRDAVSLHLRYMTRKSEYDTPTSFRKGFYESGRYIASITNVISRKRK